MRVTSAVASPANAFIQTLRPLGSVRASTPANALPACAAGATIGRSIPQEDGDAQRRELRMLAGGRRGRPDSFAGRDLSSRRGDVGAPRRDRGHAGCERVRSSHASEAAPVPLRRSR